MAEAYTSSVGGAQQKNGIVDRVKETATAQLSTQKERGTDALGRVADAVRSSTQKLRDERHETIASYVDKAADQIESWSRRLRDKDVDELMSDVQRLARRQPAVFIGSAFALGLVGARFLKSSRQQDENGGERDWRRTGDARYAGIGAGTAAGIRSDGTRTRDDDAMLVGEVAISDIDIDATTDSPAAGAVEGTPRSTRARRSTSRTERS